MANHKGRSDYGESVELMLKERLSYDPDTGVFHWKFLEGLDHKSRMFNTKFAGKVAGTVKKVRNQEGYIYIHTAGYVFKAHRLAWWFVYGEWPTNEIDHINHIRSDNRIKNLRVVDRSSQNKSASKRKDNTSGYCGVTWHKGLNKWMACINVNGKRIHLGYHVDLQDAVLARLAAEKEHGFSKTHGKNPNIYTEKFE